MKAGIDYIGVSVGAFIINYRKEVLLVKRSKFAKNERGKWEAPGGAVEFGEKREDAIKREIKEELGVDIKIIKVLNVADEILKKDKQHWLPTTFLVRIKKGRPKIMEPRKHEKVGWFKLNKIPKPLSLITKLDIAEYNRQFKK